MIISCPQGKFLQNYNQWEGFLSQFPYTYVKQRHDLLICWTGRSHIRSTKPRLSSTLSGPAAGDSLTIRSPSTHVRRLCDTKLSQATSDRRQGIERRYPVRPSSPPATRWRQPEGGGWIRDGDILEKRPRPTTVNSLPLAPTPHHPTSSHCQHCCCQSWGKEREEPAGAYSSRGN